MVERPEGRTERNPASTTGAGKVALWAAGSAVAAVAVRALLEPTLEADQPYLTIFPAVVLATLAGGWKAGALCMVLAAGALLYLIVPPTGAWPMLGAEEWLSLIMVLAIGTLLVGVGEGYRRMRLDSERAAAEARQAAASLRESEERFRRLAELSPDAIFVLADGVVAFANASSLKLLGASDPAQVMGHSPLEIVHPDSRKDVEARLGRLLATGKPNPPMEQKYYRFDGTMITVEASSTLVPWSGTLAVQVIARDVTERNRADKELRASKQALEDFFEHSPIPIHWLDRQGCIIRANRAELDLLGYAPEEYIGCHERDIYVDPLEADEIHQRLFEGQPIRQHELRIRTRDGEMRDVLLDASVQHRNGELVQACCFMVDVTEQRRAQRAVNIALERFTLCARATNDAIYDWNLADDEVEWNESLRAIAGEECEMKSSRIWWREHVHLDDLERVETSLTKAIDSDAEQWRQEYRFKRSDDSYASIVDRAFIQRDSSGNAVRVVGALIDMTERRRWEDELAQRARELERSNADLEEFAGVISHDLKAPLRGIADHARWLLQDYGDRFDDEGRDILHTLVRVTGRMHELLEALLEYARVGRAELQTTETDLNATLGNVLDALQTQLKSDHCQVVLASSLPHCRCDPLLVSQVFTNLIVNGIKYNTHDDKRIEIGARYEGECPVIYVRDNGIGIEPRHRDAIFNMFRRLHARDSFGGGTGSGLSIVKKIVERHGGRIWVESKPGEGSTFYFTLGPPLPADPPAIITLPKRKHRVE